MIECRTLLARRRIHNHVFVTALHALPVPELVRFTDPQPRSLPRPEFRRVILEIVFDESGNMWVERESGSGRGFDVFDGAGRLLGSVASPVRFDRVAPYIRGNRIYFVTTDSLDVQYVVVREVMR